MILVVSDLDLKGSGYMQIVIGLAEQMAARGHKVKVLGFGYAGGEHNWPFSIIPVRTHEAWLQTPHMVRNLVTLGQAGQSEPVEALIVALDIPHQARALMMPHTDYPYIGIFPIESGPLCTTWANVVAGMDASLVISKFGERQILDVNGKATYLPVGLDTASWRLPGETERESIRKQMDLKDYFVVLTVADNQERKNLSAGMAAIAKVRDAGIPVRWMLVTRVESPVGWRLGDLAWKYGLQENVMTFERGIPHDRLWLLHAASDAFLLPSKAEGLCAIPGSPVWTKHGVRPIEDVQPGDLVLTHRGRFRPVGEIYSRHYAGEIVVLEPRFGLPSLRLTPEHPVLTYRRRRFGGRIRGDRRLVDSAPVWVSASALETGDFLVYRAGEEYEIPTLRVADYVPDTIDVDGGIALKGRNQFGDVFPHPTAHRHEAEIKTTEGLMFLLGLYIAEGCYTAQGPGFALASYETSLQERLAESLETVFGANIRGKHLGRNRWYGIVNDRLVGRLLAAWAGRSSHEKHIPDWALWLPPKFAWPLVEALFAGDGSLQTRRQWRLGYSTVSERLAQELQFLLARLGIMTYLRRAKRGDFEVRIHGRDLAKVPFLNGRVPGDIGKRKGSSRWLEPSPGMIAVPVKSTSRLSYVGPVHNLEVDEDETYLMGGGIVHNCMPVMEAMACGVPVVATDCAAISEHLWEDPEHHKGQRGFPIQSEYKHIDPWGNSIRHYASAESAAKQLIWIYRAAKKNDKRLAEIVQRARWYVEGRSWDVCGGVLEEALQGAIAKYRQMKPQGVVVPATVPSLVPFFQPPEVTNE